MRTHWLLSLILLLPCAGYSAPAQPVAAELKVLSGAATMDNTVRRDGHATVRLQPGAQAQETAVELGPVTLVPGRHYVLTGWVRTEKVQVADRGRTPIATGAALSMASMPFDVHSVSFAGTRDWTEIKLPFTASAAKDAPVLRVGAGGTWSGQAWFAGVRVDGLVNELPWPVKAAVETYGPAYRYPEGGWIYLHIEGEPYERGYQHGHLMAREFESYMQRCASTLDGKPVNDAWEWARLTADALFLRGFDKEILTEMQGIADGAADAGAKWNGRKVDLLDVVVTNTIVELGELHGAMPMTPTGLEGLSFEKPSYAQSKVPVTARCSAFCATGKATRDGRMVIAHITMWPLTLAEQTNVLLDIQPTTGHRMLIQSYAGGIESGTDWYQNDAGMVLTETTIRQSPFNVNGLPVAYRARKAIQYGDSIDKVVEYLGTKNNGLYTNEWLIADAKTNEIAMYELGTYKTRLYRSSKNDWFGGTEGFYWGDNNAKDLNVRLEYQPDPAAAPSHIPYRPFDRDLTWQNLYEKHRGQIDEQFAFEAFRTAPLVTASSMDAKVATAEMAGNLMVWANFGKPNQREWVPGEYWKNQYSGNRGLYAGGYRLFDGKGSPELRALVKEKEQERLAGASDAPGQGGAPGSSFEGKLWKGWILPASDEDAWFSAGSAMYYRLLQWGGDLDKKLERCRATLRAATFGPLNETGRFDVATNKGILLLDALRRDMGDDKFFALMRDFFAANTTKTVSTAQFRQAAGAKESAIFDRWLNAAGLPDDKGGAAYVGADIRNAAVRLPHTLLVYGTAMEAGANRYAAETIRDHMLDWFEQSVPVVKDFEVSDADLKDREVIFIGRPETNSALAAWQDKLKLNYSRAVFRVGARDYGSEEDALIWAGANPLDRSHMIVVIAGNSPLETVRLADEAPGQTQYSVYRAGREVASGFEY